MANKTSERAHTLMTEVILLSGRTQADIAARMGVSQPALARLLRRPGNPTVNTLARLYAACGYELSFQAVKKNE